MYVCSSMILIFESTWCSLKVMSSHGTSFTVAGVCSGCRWFALEFVVMHRSQHTQLPRFYSSLNPIPNPIANQKSYIISQTLISWLDWLEIKGDMGSISFCSEFWSNVVLVVKGVDLEEVTKFIFAFKRFGNEQCHIRMQLRLLFPDFFWCLFNCLNSYSEFWLENLVMSLINHKTL